MKKGLKALTFFAALTVVMSAAVSCGNVGQADPSDSSGTESAAATEVITEEHDFYLKAVPELDLKGGKFRVLNQATGSYYYQLLSEAQNGEILNDAIYTRNAELENRYNIKFTEKLIENREEHLAAARAFVLAGEDAYDIIMTDDRNSWALATEGFALSYNELPYVDLTRDWWSQSINSDISIRGKLYFSYGDYNLTSYSAVNVLMFNHTLAQNYKLDSFYDTVRGGAWTLDKLYSLVTQTSKDLNGDGKRDADDQYGITSHYKQMLPCFWIGSAMRSITKSADDEPVFSLTGNEKFASFYFDFMDKMHTGDVYFNSSVLKDYADNTVFKEDRALFNVVRTHFIMRFYRDMPGDFGIIPFPKYDDKQDGYLSRTEGGLLPVVPVTTEPNKELVGAVMESMAAYSREYVVPVYYETVLKDKFARDVDSLEMLDIIFNNRVYDLGDTIWNGYVRDGVFAGMFNNNDRDLTSKLVSMEASVTAQINTAIELFKKL